MKHISYKDKEYSYTQYLDLLKLSPDELDGEITFIQTGDMVSANDETTIRHYYHEKYDEARSIIRNQKNNKEKLIESLILKYEDNTINKFEIGLLLKLTRDRKRYDKITNQLIMNYNNFYTVNMDTPKPEGMSYQDYGRFVDMLNYCFNYKNELVYKNGKQIQKVNLQKVLEFNSKRSLYSFIKKLKDLRMIAETKSGNKKFLTVNPYYANRNLKITKEIYILFEDDLKDCFDDLEIKYIMEEDIDIYDSSMVEVE